MSSLKLHLFSTVTEDYVPTLSMFTEWVEAALTQKNKEISIKIVDSDEMRSLNSTYRKIDQTTDVLSFPTETLARNMNSKYLGDIAMCAQVINQAAIELKKSKEEHWAHITIHAILHLLGYNHISKQEKQHMQSLESHLMQKLLFSDPWSQT